MLLVVSASFAPLVFFSITGIVSILFPRFVLNLKTFNGSMNGSVFNNNLQFRDSALWVTRILGFFSIGIGIGLFMLINGWLDF